LTCLACRLQAYRAEETQATTSATGSATHGGGAGAAAARTRSPGRLEDSDDPAAATGGPGPSTDIVHQVVAAPPGVDMRPPRRLPCQDRSVMLDSNMTAASVPSRPVSNRNPRQKRRPPQETRQRNPWKRTGAGEGRRRTGHGPAGAMRGGIPHAVGGVPGGNPPGISRVGV